MSIAEKLKLIDTLKGKIDELIPRKDWDDAFFRKVKFDFTYASNKLEGSTLTYGQTIKLLKDFVTPKDATLIEKLNPRLGSNRCMIVTPNMPFERAPSFNWVSVHLVNFIFIFYFNMGCWLQY